MHPLDTLFPSQHIPGMCDPLVRRLGSSFVVLAHVRSSSNRGLVTSSGTRFSVRVYTVGSGPSANFLQATRSCAAYTRSTTLVTPSAAARTSPTSSSSRPSTSPRHTRSSSRFASPMPTRRPPPAAERTRLCLQPERRRRPLARLSSRVEPQRERARPHRRRTRPLERRPPALPRAWPGQVRALHPQRTLRQPRPPPARPPLRQAMRLPRHPTWLGAHGGVAARSLGGRVNFASFIVLNVMFESVS
jgi:hypothetical protein